MTSMLLAILSQLSNAAANELIPLDPRHRLFLDDSLIASMEHLQRRVHPARKAEQNPVLWPEQEWEGAFALTFGSILHDEGRFRIWYLSGPGVSYAESPDGIHWTKPALGLFHIDGHDTNAVVRRAVDDEPPSLPHFYELFGVFKDPADPDPQRRYKMGYLSLQRDYSGDQPDAFHPGQRRGLGVAGSPDGIRWEPIEPWATEAICDGETHWTYDPARRQYLLFGAHETHPLGGRNRLARR